MSKSKGDVAGQRARYKYRKQNGLPAGAPVPHIPCSNRSRQESKKYNYENVSDDDITRLMYNNLALRQLLQEHSGMTVSQVHTAVRARLRRLVRGCNTGLPAVPEKTVQDLQRRQKERKSRNVPEKAKTFFKMQNAVNKIGEMDANS